MQIDAKYKCLQRETLYNDEVFSTCIKTLYTFDHLSVKHLLCSSRQYTLSVSSTTSTWNGPTHSNSLAGLFMFSILTYYFLLQIFTNTSPRESLINASLPSSYQNGDMAIVVNGIQKATYSMVSTSQILFKSLKMRYQPEKSVQKRFYIWAVTDSEIILLLGCLASTFPFLSTNYPSIVSISNPAFVLWIVKALSAFTGDTIGHPLLMSTHLISLEQSIKNRYLSCATKVSSKSKEGNFLARFQPLLEYDSIFPLQYPTIRFSSPSIFANFMLITEKSEISWIVLRAGRVLSLYSLVSSKLFLYYMKCWTIMTGVRKQSVLL